MPSNHLILCRPLLLLPSTFPNIRVFSNESGLCIRWPNIGASASAVALPVNTPLHGCVKGGSVRGSLHVSGRGGTANPELEPQEARPPPRGTPESLLEAARPAVGTGHHGPGFQGSDEQSTAQARVHSVGAQSCSLTLLGGRSCPVSAGPHLWPRPASQVSAPGAFPSDSCHPCPLSPPWPLPLSRGCLSHGAFRSFCLWLLITGGGLGSGAGGVGPWLSVSLLSHLLGVQ